MGKAVTADIFTLIISSFIHDSSHDDISCISSHHYKLDFSNKEHSRIFVDVCVIAYFSSCCEHQINNNLRHVVLMNTRKL